MRTWENPCYFLPSNFQSILENPLYDWNDSISHIKYTISTAILKCLTIPITYYLYLKAVRSPTEFSIDRMWYVLQATMQQEPHCFKKSI